MKYWNHLRWGNCESKQDKGIFADTQRNSRSSGCLSIKWLIRTSCHKGALTFTVVNNPPKARPGPKTKMWYFHGFKYTYYVQIILFLFESSMSKPCLKEGLQEHGDEDNKDGALLRQRATKFCLNMKLSKQKGIPKKNVSNNFFPKLTRNSDGILRVQRTPCPHVCKNTIFL